MSFVWWIRTRPPKRLLEKVASAGFAKEELFVLTSGRGNTDDSADQREAKAGERGPLSEGTGLLAGIGPVCCWRRR